MVLSAPPSYTADTLAHFLVQSWKTSVNLLYEATENELQVSGMTISKKSNGVLKVTYFEIIACPQTSTLKLKVLMLKF
jgi:hypothetical protein